MSLSLSALPRANEPKRKALKTGRVLKLTLYCLNFRGIKCHKTLTAWRYGRYAGIHKTFRCNPKPIKNINFIGCSSAQFITSSWN